MLFASAAGLMMASAAGQPSPPRANDAEQPTIVVTAPAGALDRNGAISVEADAIRGSGKPDLFEALERSVPGLSLQEAQNNPYQPNLVYRGFTVSPLQGQAQGLAVYLDGARFNQPFGDTVQFDLLPEAAIERIELRDATPVYGLNALGGAMVVATKTGRSAPGLFVSGAAGRYGEVEGVAEAGWAGERESVYLALAESHDGGWRRFSPSTVYNGFADLGWDARNGGLHLKLVGADTALTGNGSAPVELLEADYRAIFTHPDNTRNRYGRASLHPWVALSDAARIEATLYVQRLRQRTLNGDAADIEACEDEAGLLCLETATGEDEELLLDANGEPITDSLDGEGYGVLNRSATRSTAGGILAQLSDRRPLFGGTNQLVLGFSHDRSGTRFDSFTELGALTDERSVAGLGAILAQPDGSIAPVSLTAKTRYTGLFLADRLPMGDRLTLELGLRWNDARIILEDHVGTALNGRHRFRRLNPGMELEWEAARNLTLRAGYSEANRAPTPAELACADEEAPCSLTNFFIADPPLKQVVSRSLKVGASDAVGPLKWLLSIYRTTSADDIQFVASEIRGRAFFQNIGQTRRQGIEATVDYQRGGLSVRAGYALTDATYQSPLLLNAPNNPEAGSDGRIGVEPNDQLPGVPRHRAIVSLGFDAGAWVLGGDIQATSGQYLFGDEANLQSRTEPYAIVNVRGSARLLGPVTLFGEVRNLFNKRYASFGAFGATDEIELEEAPAASDPRSLGPGAPRRWTVGLRASF